MQMPVKEVYNNTRERRRGGGLETSVSTLPHLHFFPHNWQRSAVSSQWVWGGIKEKEQEKEQENAGPFIYPQKYVFSQPLFHTWELTSPLPNPSSYCLHDGILTFCAGGSLPAFLADTGERVTVHHAGAPVLTRVGQTAAVLGCKRATKRSEPSELMTRTDKHDSNRTKVTTLKTHWRNITKYNISQDPLQLNFPSHNLSAPFAR